LAELIIVQVIGCVEDECYFFYVDLRENRIAKLINHAIGACHSHVQPKVLHFAKLSF
jgi:hypothetical protein